MANTLAKLIKIFKPTAGFQNTVPGAYSGANSPGSPQGERLYEFPHIRFVDTPDEIKKTPFGNDTNLIVYVASVEEIGDMKEVTNYLLDQKYILKQGAPPRKLREDEGVNMIGRAANFEPLLKAIQELSPEGQKAAKYMYKTIARYTSDKNPGRFLLQAPWYQSQERKPHTDGDEEGRIVCRFSANSTEYFNNKDVIAIDRSLDGGYSTMVEEPRIVTFRPGSIMKHKPGQTGFRENFLQAQGLTTMPITHQKAACCGEAGAIFSRDL